MKLLIFCPREGVVKTNIHDLTLTGVCLVPTLSIPWQGAHRGGE